MSRPIDSCASALVTFAAAASLDVGGYIVDGEGLVHQINAVHREDGFLWFGLDRNPFLIMPPSKTKKMRPKAQVRVPSPEGEAVHEGRAFSWLPGCAP